MPVDLIKRAFKPVLGKPAWNARQGTGSSLVFEFGRPHLLIFEPHDTTSTSRRIREWARRRKVVLCGEWHLWIQFCQWKIFQEEKLTAFFAPHDTSRTKAIERAMKRLDGQTLKEVVVDRRRLRSTFTFDLGGRLETSRYYRGDKTDPQWWLSDPAHRYLAFRGDGRISVTVSKPKKHRWIHREYE
jgi:hypothetical protein